MRISICDDEEVERQKIFFLLKEYFRKKSGAEILKFQSASSLLEYEKITGPSDIYILDIIMPKTNGIALGRTLYKKNSSSLILYLTSSRDFAIDAFSAKAFSYLLKPVEREKLFYELDLCFQKLNQAEKKIKIKNKDGEQVLNMDEIFAVEYYGHRLIYHTTFGKIEGLYRRESFDECILEFTQSGRFIKISASFVLNARHIKKMSGEFFFMQDGSSYKITRRYIEAKKRYMDFVLHGGGVW